jgi:hypothetical protein
MEARRILDPLGQEPDDWDFQFRGFELTAARVVNLVFFSACELSLCCRPFQSTKSVPRSSPILNQCAQNAVWRPFANILPLGYPHTRNLSVLCYVLEKNTQVVTDPAFKYDPFRSDAIITPAVKRGW